MKNAGIITIGDELLQGFTNDTNATWISNHLLENNIETSIRLSVGDEKNMISNVIEYLLSFKRNDYIIITGGLGPTHDDITKKVLSEYFKSKLIIDEKYLEKLKLKCLNNNISIPTNIETQALILENAEPIINISGTALGMCVDVKKTKIIVLPGVPEEMKQMLVRYEFLVGEKNKYITLKTTGIYESKMYDMLEKIIRNNKNNFKIAFLPKHTGVNVRISKKNENVNDNQLKKFKETIANMLGEYIYSESKESLEEVLGKMLINNKLTLSIAESCTGGLISKKITDVPGSSKYFLGSIVAYNNKLKIKFLNVKQDDLNKKGAVSPEVAIQMAYGIKNKCNSDVAISTTGISGPTGQTDNKKIGLVYIAIVYKKDVIVKKFNLLPLRRKHREIASAVALNMLRLLLINDK